MKIVVKRGIRRKFKGLGILSTILVVWIIFGYLIIDGVIMLVTSIKNRTFDGFVGIALDTLILIVYFSVFTLAVWLLIRVISKGLFRRWGGMNRRHR
jgi:uncharacterized membrane protein HdeD (DUF308 family)